jgi:hypothetical protein
VLFDQDISMTNQKPEASHEKKGARLVVYAMITAATAAAPASTKEAAFMLAAPVYLAMAPVPVAEIPWTGVAPVPEAQAAHVDAAGVPVEAAGVPVEAATGVLVWVTTLDGTLYE